MLMTKEPDVLKHFDLNLPQHRKRYEVHLAALARIKAEDLANAEEGKMAHLALKPKKTKTTTRIDTYGREVMVCCSAPVEKVVASQAFYQRHKNKVGLPACHPAKVCNRAYEKQLRGKTDRHHTIWPDPSNPAECCGAPTDEEEYQASSRFVERHKLGTRVYPKSEPCEYSRICARLARKRQRAKK